MNALVMIGQLLLGLSLLVFVHELGHYLFARLFGIRVDKFYLFFDAGGFKLLHFKIGETEYGIGWIPLGGYCKIAGMVDESMDKESLKKAPQPWEFRSKPAWQRFFVIIGGVLMNLILGIIIFTALLQKQGGYLPTQEVNRYGIYAYPSGRALGFKTGDRIIGTHEKAPQRFSDVLPQSVLLGGAVKVERGGKVLWIDIPGDTYKKLGADTSGFPLFDITNYPTVVKNVAEGSAAESSGLQAGDHILAVDGKEAPSFGQFKEFMAGRRNDSFLLEIVRNGDTLALAARTDSSGLLGFYTDFPYTYENYHIGSALRYGTTDALNLLWTNIRGIGKVMSGQEKARETLQGPIGIASVYGSVWNWFRFWYITGMLSLVLAFMNIIPIPGLDGGHLMFTLYEMITRRKVSDRVLEGAQMIGMILIVVLFVFVIFNDIGRLLH